MTLIIILKAGCTGLADSYSIVPNEQRKKECRWIRLIGAPSLIYITQIYPFSLHTHPDFLNSMTVHAELRFLMISL